MPVTACCVAVVGVGGDESELFVLAVVMVVTVVITMMVVVKVDVMV